MTSQSMITTPVIVFDQGNTLIMDPFLKVLDLQKSKFRETFRLHGVESKFVSFEEAWESANKLVDYPFCSHFNQEEPIVQQALRMLNMPEDIAAILGPDLIREYRKGLKQIIAQDPRTLEVKRTLEILVAQGKKLGVFSNDRIIGLGLVLRTMEIISLFQYIETSEALGIEKPDPRVFQHMISFFQTDPQNITYIGDDPVRDIDPAKSMGLKAILYKVDAETFSLPWRNYSLHSRYQPDASIAGFEELVGR
jgi:HAD superfamily hydrolase (TIGR01549 family)